MSGHDARTTSAPPTDRPKLEVRHLYKIFGADPEGVLGEVEGGLTKQELLVQHQHVVGLRDINIKMYTGQITVIMGLSGSGKSTLVRHLNRLIDPTAGSVLLDGEDILALDAASLRHLRQTRISMVFQRFALFPHRTVIENAGLALRVRGNARVDVEREALRWLDTVGLASYRDYYPKELSGGMQQRVGLARALASNAEIMLMDEAFSALDPLIRTEMQELLLDLQAQLGKTIVFISHDLDEALKLADYLVILNDGVVVQADEPQRVLLHPADSYVEDFVSDINRARVLRVRSVMRKSTVPSIQGVDGTVDWNATLEHVIALSGGDTTRRYAVERDATVVGWLQMKDVVRALVPRLRSNVEESVDA